MAIFADNKLNPIYLPSRVITVLSPWMAADEARVSHVLPHVV